MVSVRILPFPIEACTLYYQSNNLQSNLRSYQHLFMRRKVRHFTFMSYWNGFDLPLLF